MYVREVETLFVKCLKERNTCCYIYHSQMEKMWQSLNNMKVVTLVVHLDCECTYQVVYRQPAIEWAPKHCGATFVVYKGVIAI